MTRLKSYSFHRIKSILIRIGSEYRISRFVLSIITDDSINIRHLVCIYFVCINYEDEDEDDDEVHRLLLMQKAGTYVTATTSLISLSTNQSRAIHAYIDRFISR